MKKRFLSALLALCVLLTALPLTGLTAFAADTRSSEQDDYTLYQANYYAQNFNFDTPTYAQSYYDALRGDSVFMVGVNTWEGIHIATEPSHSLESGMISKKDYYKLVLFDLVAQTDSPNGLDQLLDIATNKEASYIVSVSKEIMAAENVTAETLSTLTPEKATALITGSKYCWIPDSVSVVTQIAGMCANAKEVVETFAKYQAIYELKDGTKELLNTIAADMDNPYELREAASECATYFERGYDEVLNRILGGAQALAEFTMETVADVALDWAWNLIVTSTPGGAAAMAFAQGTRALANYLFSTDKEIEAYYKLEAQVAMEKALKAAIYDLQLDYNLNEDVTGAYIYMNAVDIFRKSILLGFDYSMDLLEISGNNNFNVATDFLFGDYSKCMQLLNEINGFKADKQQIFAHFEEQCLNSFKAQSYPDFDAVLEGVAYQNVPVESITLRVTGTIAVGTQGYINDYVQISYAPAGFTEITMPHWTSSDESVLQFTTDYTGTSGGVFEALAAGTCTVTCTLPSGVSQSVEVTVGAGTENPEHDYYSDFEYSVNADGTATITGYIGNAARLVIPLVIDGYTVTGIGNRAFYNCDSFTSVTIPDSVTSIGDMAFYSCGALESVTIGNGVTSIGDWAFYSCDSLTSITIPDSVTRIGDHAFRNCGSLESITIPDSVTGIGESTFDNCESLTSITIPNSVTSIGDWAFNYCRSLTSITIPDSVTHIGTSAFSYCNSLTNITIPDGVTGIGYSAFDNCESLTSITIPNSVTSIGDWAFRNCRSLTSITIPDSVTHIGDYAFRECGSLTSVTIPNSVTSIGTQAFRECSSLTSVTIPNSVTSIGEEAFYRCFSLESITISDSVTSIEDETFCSCTSLKSVTIGNGVTSIGKSAFEDCDSLKSIIIPDSVTSIGISAFGDCTSLTSITIPDSVTSIGGCAFQSCTSLTSVTIPDRVTYIGNNMFSYCDSLTNITIPDSVTEIGQWAFVECKSLTSVTIGNGVKSIGYMAFSYCASLTSITIPDSVTSIGWSAFCNCTSLESVTLGNNVTTIEDNAFDGCCALESIIIPNSISSIGDYVFEDCCALESVTVPDSITSIGVYAFSDCDSMVSIIIPDSVTSIGYSAFYGCDNLVIYGYADSYAETYAAENDIPFVPILMDSASGVTIADAAEALPENAQLTVEQVAAFADSVTYDITLTQNGVTVQPTGAVTVKIPVPDTMDGNLCRVYREETDGTYTDMNAVYQNGYMVFTTDHFSIYRLTGCLHAQTETEITAAPTCTEAGEQEIICTACGEVLATQTIPATGHSFSEWVTTTEPTCTEVGEQTRTCSTCGATETQEIHATGHNYITTTTPVTCTDDGQTAHICTFCGDTIVIETVPAPGHSFGEWLITNEPTCTEAGTQRRICVICGARETREVPATGHSYTETVTAPTCTEDGYTTHTCTACGDRYTDNTVSATGHTFGDWVTITEPTCIEAGEQTRTCSACGATETQEIPATGNHTPGEWVTTKEPTRTEEGERTQSCTVCGEVLATEPIPMLTGLLGDVNEDGKVDAVDARWVLQTAAGMRTLENMTAADVNGDGKIDAVDARWILQAAAGMRTLGA